MTEDEFFEFPRIKRLPSYVLKEVNDRKTELRKKGLDVIDLGMGNPNIPAPEPVVKKVAEAVWNPKNHRYSISHGLAKLREEIAKRYKKIWGVELDPEDEVVVVNGTKEGIFQLLFAICDTSGSVVITPEPAYPVHLYAPLLVGADVITVPLLNGDLLDSISKAVKKLYPRPKALILSFPNNPTTKCVDLEFFRKVVEFAREEKIIVIHDFAYAEITFDGYKAPSILQVEGAKNVCVELYSMSKGFSMAGFRVGFALGNRRVLEALRKVKSWMDYGIFQPIQIASIIALRECSDYPEKVAQIYKSRRDVLCSWLDRLGWEYEKPKGSMFIWAKVPVKMSSVEFSKILLEKALVAVSPGRGFGSSGEGYLRFALVENEHRIKQAMRNIKKLMERL